MKIAIKFLSLIIIVLALAGLSSCVKNDFDEPPASQFADITPNTTIADLKQMYSAFQNEENIQIVDDLTIEGIVISSDEEGNYFRELVIQDETGGIIIFIDQTDLYNDYPVGRKVFVNCKDLYLGEFAGVIQMGGFISSPGTSDERLEEIPDALISKHIFKGPRDQAITPKVVTIDELSTDRFDPHMSTLIILEDVQFIGSDVGVTYATAESPTTGNPASENRLIEDCDENTITLRSSGYADFVNDRTPAGNGTLTGIYGVFGATAQMFIRDTSDVVMEGVRCGGSTTGNCASAATEEINSIEEIRSFSGCIPFNMASGVVTGIVISDRDNGNINDLNMVFQQGEWGVVVRFTEPHNFALGTEIDLDVTGAELSDFNGLLQVNNVELSRANSQGAGTLPNPRVTTVGDLLSNANDWESTLVKFENVSMSGSTYGDGVTVNDGSGSIDMFTFFSSTFSGASVPSSATSLTAIVSRFNDPQLSIRNLGDVEGGGTGGPCADAATEEITTIEEARSLAGCAPFNIASGQITGVVTSDRTNGNLHSQNLVLQNGNWGIIIRFDQDHSYNLGDELSVNLGNAELSEFNGLLQVNNVPLGDATSMGSGTLPTPQTMTIAEILANGEERESTLVYIENVSISGSSTFDGTTELSDGTGSIDMYTRGDASFSSAAVPGGSVNVTAIITDFNGTQVFIRNIDDIE